MAWARGFIIGIRICEGKYDLTFPYPHSSPRKEGKTNVYIELLPRQVLSIYYLLTEW